VQRFVFAHPERVARAAVCGSGLYLDPRGGLFPVGVQANPFAPDLAGATLEAFQRAPMAIVVGTDDPRHPLAQTFTRNWGFELIEVPRGRHQGGDNLPAAAEYLFR
jgi:hypothetical protein